MYIVMGLPGAGKTTVLNKFLEKHLKFKHIVYGDVMFELAKEKYNIECRDDMRKVLTHDQQRDLQIEVEKRLVELYDKEKNIILDTHCAVKTPHGYLPGLPLRLLLKLHVNGIILITAKYDEIMLRREKDKDIRKRDADTIEALREHDEVNKRMAAVYSVVTGAPLLIVHNSEGHLDDAVKALETLIVGE